MLPCPVNLPQQCSIATQLLRGYQAYLDCELSLREVDGTLLDLLQRLAALVLAQTSTDGASLFWAEIEREVLLVLVEEAELRSLVGVDDCEDLCDRLADVVTEKKNTISLLLLLSLPTLLVLFPSGGVCLVVCLELEGFLG